MLKYQSLHYLEYKEMFSNGECRSISRHECFAPTQKPTASNPLIQRWYYSPDQTIAIRLPRNAMGDEIGRENAADLKWLEHTKTYCYCEKRLHKALYSDPSLKDILKFSK